MEAGCGRGRGRVLDLVGNASVLVVYVDDDGDHAEGSHALQNDADGRE